MKNKELIKIIITCEVCVVLAIAIIHFIIYPYMGENSLIYSILLGICIGTIGGIFLVTTD
jgi:hypothetical protein